MQGKFASQDGGWLTSSWHRTSATFTTVVVLTHRRDGNDTLGTFPLRRAVAAERPRQHGTIATWQRHRGALDYVTHTAYDQVVWHTGTCTCRLHVRTCMSILCAICSWHHHLVKPKWSLHEVPLICNKTKISWNVNLDYLKKTNSSFSCTYTVCNRILMHCALRATSLIVARVFQRTALQLTVTSVEAVVAVAQVVTIGSVLVVAASAPVHARHAVARIP